MPFSVTLSFEDLDSGAPVSTTSLVFGVSATSTDGFDSAEDVLAPPGAPLSSNAVFLSGLASPLDRFSTDYRADAAIGQQLMWRIVINAADQRVGRLSWGGGFPPDLSQLTIIESDNTGTPLGGANELSLFAAGSLQTGTGPETRYYLIKATRSAGTPTPTATPTPTPTATPCPTLGMDIDIDSDGDGFSDALEEAYAGDRLNPAIYPDFADINNDSTTNILDALILSRMVELGTITFDCQHDVNQDGTLDQSDAQDLFEWSIGLRDLLPTT